jgi:DNA invertase Pin-like site-specific DNA recombinase
MSCELRLDVKNARSSNRVPAAQCSDTAVRDALIGFMAAMAQAQAEATKAAQRAGIDHARAAADRHRGRKPSYTALTAAHAAGHHRGETRQ